MNFVPTLEKLKEFLGLEYDQLKGGSKIKLFLKLGGLLFFGSYIIYLFLKLVLFNNDINIKPVIKMALIILSIFVVSIAIPHHVVDTTNSTNISNSGSNHVESIATGFKDKYNTSHLNSPNPGDNNDQTYWFDESDEGSFANDTTRVDGFYNTYTVSYINTTNIKHAKVDIYETTDVEPFKGVVYIYGGFMANVTFSNGVNEMFWSSSTPLDKEYSQSNSDGDFYYNTNYNAFMKELEGAMI